MFEFEKPKMKPFIRAELDYHTDIRALKSDSDKQLPPCTTESRGCTTFDQLFMLAHLVIAHANASKHTTKETLEALDDLVRIIEAQKMVRIDLDSMKVGKKGGGKS